VTVPTGPPGARQSTYLVSVLQSLGYRARLRTFPSPDAYEKARSKGTFQVGPAGWQADFPAPSNFFVPLLTCAGVGGSNLAAFCNRSIDQKIRRATALEVTDPQAATALWSRIDRDVMQQAPWAPYANGSQIDVVSRRVGNYQYSLQWGPLFDQMWVR
jgi:peptide/nickel transport system substrate-binding protein